MNKRKKIILIGTPIVVASTFVGIYYIVKKTEKVKEKHERTSQMIKEVKKTVNKKGIFPNITYDEIYDEIIMENNAPYISDDMIAKFIKLVFMRIGTSDGEVKVEIISNDRTNVLLRFSWMMDKVVKEIKIYNLHLTMQDLV